MADLSHKSSRLRRMGRPRVSPEAARRNRVVTMVTDREMAELQKQAEAEGMSISAYVHQIVTSFLKQHQ